MFKKLAIALIISIFVLAGYWSYWSTDNRLHIYFLDVGQGDAILIRTPDQKYLLIDGGPDKKLLLSQLGEILPPWQRNLDLVIASHADADHITGLVAVLQKYDVQKVIVNYTEHPTKIYEELKAESIKKNRQAVDMNSDFVFGCCLKLDFLWPNPQIKMQDTDTNSLSISLILTYLNFQVYFDGDLPSNYEDQLIGLYDVDVLKVSHHGSKTGTDPKFLQQIKPEVAVISAGKKNKYGHPAQQTLENLAANNTEILRTDLIGRVEIISDGQTYTY